MPAPSTRHTLFAIASALVLAGCATAPTPSAEGEPEAPAAEATENPEADEVAEVAAAGDEAWAPLVEGSAAAWLDGEVDGLRFALLSPPGCGACGPAEERVRAMDREALRGQSIEVWHLEDEATHDRLIAHLRDAGVNVFFPQLLSLDGERIVGVATVHEARTVAAAVARGLGEQPVLATWEDGAQKLRYRLRGGSAPAYDLGGVDLTGAGLHHADLSGSSLRGAVLRDAVLDRVNFSGADLTEADFTGTRVGDVFWTGATCPDGTEAAAHGNTCAGHLGAETTAWTAPAIRACWKRWDAELASIEDPEALAAARAHLGTRIYVLDIKGIALGAPVELALEDAHALVRANNDAVPEILSAYRSAILMPAVPGQRDAGVGILTFQDPDPAAGAPGPSFQWNLATLDGLPDTYPIADAESPCPVN